MTAQPGAQDTSTDSMVSSFWTRLQGEWRTARDLPARLERPAVIALFLLAALLRLITLGQDSLWIDEGYTLAAAGLSYGHIFSVPFDTHPPLHFALVKVFTGFLSGEWAVRLPSALFALASLVPAWLLARRLMGSLGALAVLGVLALSYTHIVYANNGRDYALLLFFLFLAAYAIQGFTDALLRGPLISRQTLKWGALYALAAAGGLYTHNTAILYLFVLNAGLSVWVLFHAPRKSFGVIAGLGVVHLLPFLIWAPWLLVMLGTSGAFDWLHQMSPVEAAVTLAATIGPNSVPAPLMLVFFIALLAGLGMAVLRPGWSAVMIILHLIAFPGFIWLMGFVYKPIYMERIILPALLGGALAIGYFAAHARRDWLAGGLTGLALLVSLISAGAYTLRGDSASNVGAQVIQDWRGAITAQAEAGETLIICDTFTWPVVHEYAGARRVLVHHERGVWDLTPADWRDNYGRPVAERMQHAADGMPDWMLRTEVAWPETVAASPSLVFLKADILCNDGEPEELRARLIASGYKLETTGQWRGVSAERYVR
ncbi:MAG: glycosyltransferase family 39 protein [Hyphomonadaceae bacterium]|nr:glycosyltransferase family 39 protein [Hyphomonadaceae bacterium]